MIFVADIIRHAERVFDAEPGTIKGQAKHRSVARARFAVWHTARELTGQSYPQLGRFTGGRDHSTVRHGVLQCANLMERFPEYRASVVQLRAACLEDMGA